MGARSRDDVGHVVVGLCLMAVVVGGIISIGGAEAHLRPNFYDQSCPQIYDIVKAEIKKAVAAEARMAASLVRLHFHDCFVNGCDGSLLLNSTATFDSEKFSFANNNSARGFAVIDTIKAALEAACPQTVSCADILAIASRDSAVEAGLCPEYPVFFGRRDSLTANQSAANAFLPAPSFNYSQLEQNFKAVGLNEVDLVALSGAHTIGRVACQNVRPFLNDTDTNAAFRERNNKICPADGDPLAVTDLDFKTPDTFDNVYYRNLRHGEGILRSDQTLQSTPGLNVALVAGFAFSHESFFLQFALSSIKMGNISPLVGDQGEIRLNCALVNSPPSSSSTPAVSSTRVASQ